MSQKVFVEMINSEASKTTNSGTTKITSSTRRINPFRKENNVN